MAGDLCSLVHAHALSLSSHVVEHVSELHVGDSSVSVGIEHVHKEHDVHLAWHRLPDLHEETLAHLRELEDVKTSGSVTVVHHEDLLGVHLYRLQVKVVLLHLVASKVLLSVIVASFKIKTGA